MEPFNYRPPAPFLYEPRQKPPFRRLLYYIRGRLGSNWCVASRRRRDAGVESGSVHRQGLPDPRDRRSHQGPPEPRLPLPGHPEEPRLQQVLVADSRWRSRSRSGSRSRERLSPIRRRSSRKFFWEKLLYVLYLASINLLPKLVV